MVKCARVPRQYVGGGQELLKSGDEVVGDGDRGNRSGRAIVKKVGLRRGHDPVWKGGSCRSW
eukprot:11875717-Prorocentrum_lima.AAC.1